MQIYVSLCSSGLQISREYHTKRGNPWKPFIHSRLLLRSTLLSLDRLPPYQASRVSVALTYAVDLWGTTHIPCKCLEQSQTHLVLLALSCPLWIELEWIALWLNSDYARPHCLRQQPRHMTKELSSSLHSQEQIHHSPDPCERVRFLCQLHTTLLWSTRGADSQTQGLFVCLHRRFERLLLSSEGGCYRPCCLLVEFYPLMQFYFHNSASSFPLGFCFWMNEQTCSLLDYNLGPLELSLNLSCQTSLHQVILQHLVLGLFLQGASLHSFLLYRAPTLKDCKALEILW